VGVAAGAADLGAVDAEGEEGETGRRERQRPAKMKKEKPKGRLLASFTRSSFSSTLFMKRSTHISVGI
jgi:hypothetical protein